MAISTSITNGIKQWLCYPQEFRIDTPKYLELSKSIKALNDSLRQPPDLSRGMSDEIEAFIAMAIDVGTLVWRVQKRLSMMGSPSKEFNRISRDIASTYDALSNKGIEIKDHNGQDYVHGMILRVVTSEPVKNLTQTQIIETLKPTIFYREKIVQMGEVIIGVPEKNQ